MAVDAFDPNQTTDPFRPKLQDAYRKYLGRDLGENEGQNWYGRANFEQEIADSPEARAYRAQQSGTDPNPTPDGGGSAQTKPWNEDAFWKDLLGSGGRTTSDLTRFLTDSGWGTHVRQFGSKNDKVQLPGGSAWDVVMSAGMGGGQGFYRGSLDGDGGSSGGRSAGYDAATSRQDPRVQDALSRLFARGFAPVDANDAAIQGQFAPTSREVDRGAARARQQAAERAAVGGSLVGGEGGAFDATVNGINENATEQKSGLMAELMAKEVQARREDVITALSGAQGEERMQLQAYLQQLNNELQRYGIDTNAGLQRASMNQQNQQFYDNFSWQMANSANSNNPLIALIEQLFT